MKNPKSALLLILPLGAVVLLPEKYFVVKLMLAFICLVFGIIQTRQMYKNDEITKAKIYTILFLVGLPLVLNLAAFLYL